MNPEKWKVIEGYDEMYEVSTHGRVRSWNNNGNNRKGRRKEPRKLQPAGIRYLTVSLCQQGKGKRCTIHTLVLSAFVGSCPPGLEGCHNDGERTNNHLGNLRWDTHAANMREAIAHGAWAPGGKGEAHNQAKLNEKGVIEMRTLYSRGGITYSELGKRFGVSKSHVCRIVRRKTWRHI